MLGALESKVKHAQCFDMALMKDGSIVLASKDYRLYIYRYVKVLVLLCQIHTGFEEEVFILQYFVLRCISHEHLW